jgi:ribosomal protein L40E
MPEKSNSKALIKIPKLAGKYKQVRVSFIGASFFRPRESSGAKLADDSFGPFILDEIFRRQSILSKTKGILKKTHVCRKCEADLMGLTAHRRIFSLTISYKEMPPFKLEIEMPAIPCRKCGTSNAVNEEATEMIITGAIASAFESLKNTIRD